MKQEICKFFMELEQKCAMGHRDDFLLWPNTKMQDMQEWIKLYYGIQDDVKICGSRSHIVCEQIKKLINDKKINLDFSILDICCGDALILHQIKIMYDESLAIGFDINKGRCETHEIVTAVGVKLFFGYIQELFCTNPKEKFDIIMMFNTFRAWDRAQLRETERNLPEIAMKWIIKNARYLLLTVNDNQLRFFQNISRVSILGKGEQESHFILVETGII